MDDARRFFFAHSDTDGWPCELASIGPLTCTEIPAVLEEREPLASAHLAASGVYAAVAVRRLQERHLHLADLPAPEAERRVACSLDDARSRG